MEYLQIGKMTRKLIKSYCSRQMGDVEKLLDKNIIWLGTEGGGYLQGHKKVREYLDQLYFPEASVAEQKYIVIFGNERLCGLAGKFFVSCPVLQENEIWNGTILWKRTESEPKATYVHLSKYSEDMEKERYWILDKSGRSHCLRSRDIIYVEACRNYVIIHCVDKQVMVMETMASMEEMLSDTFLRIHRSYLINREYVLEAGRCFVKMINGDEIQVPVKRYCAVRKMLEFH